MESAITLPQSVQSLFYVSNGSNDYVCVTHSCREELLFLSLFWVSVPNLYRFGLLPPLSKSHIFYMVFSKRALKTHLILPVQQTAD